MRQAAGALYDMQWHMYTTNINRVAVRHVASFKGVFTHLRTDANFNACTHSGCCDKGELDTPRSTDPSVSKCQGPLTPWL